MRPSKFVAAQEHNLNRPLRADEIKAIQAARAACKGGKQDTVKAMRRALEAVNQASAAPKAPAST